MLETLLIYGSPTFGIISTSPYHSLCTLEFRNLTPPTITDAAIFANYSASLCYVYAPYASGMQYMTTPNFPQPNTYIRGLMFHTFENGVSLPTTFGPYNLAWYATKDDAKAAMRGDTVTPLTIGNGKEIYGMAFMLS